ncbi:MULTISPECIES: methyltransferase [unclassified Oceanobacter]|uniref:methyltransferase n=1 Tax=unclassified Oceanobacter TaxID=2620260 RepID=UPI002735E729|nr:MULTISPECIES: methyltransferase [unclassified Oceanobacter]MDP2608524.1 methyltransferase [Oceanobacter sp. 1_MG-2023]MDP2611714.1 methyltransferase [Oceanobacter sp. 2_MG-2023]
MAWWQATSLQLACFPAVPEQIARPWDSADEYLLDHLDRDAPTLLFNDRYGALSCALTQPVSWLDSACAQRASRDNRQRNSLELADEHWIHEASHLQNSQVQQVVIRLPKNFEQLRYWLQLCHQHLDHKTPLYLAGMAKHIPVRWLNWLEQHSAEYRQMPIQRKARLLQIRLPVSDPGLRTWQGYTVGQLNIQALPGVFSRSNLDPGTAFLLHTLEDTRLALPTFSGRLCDLGCGNGVLGLWLKQRQPELQLIQTDDYLPAVISAQHNAANAGLEVSCYHGHSLNTIREPLDWVVCNPPFHDGHKQLNNIANDMFRDAARQLQPDGNLLVVANRHLNYPPLLKRLFSQVQRISADQRFVIFWCQTPKC